MYQKCVMQNDTVSKQIGLLTNEEQYQSANIAQMSNLYIDFNKDRFKSNSFSIFTKGFQTHLAYSAKAFRQDINDVLTDKTVFVPIMPPKSLFRNIEYEIEYFEDIYDEYIERIETRNSAFNVKTLTK